ncbi:SCO family protein [Sporosarcina sp. YIM B06819]|uniref:SCO family protein n=1 Tax=Sporosarcina sp. YIM B06819 TaxID=3081769 RepID=UPI00298CAE9A|nr:SCO family protein [Sporosarcina sp. YIM B06819]
MKKINGLLFVIVFTLLLSACGTKPITSQPMSSFSFTDQDGQAFGTNELTGTIWIADFIFTQCDTVCLPMMSETAALQQLFKEQGLQVKFVSFTVDPTVDTPEILKEYISQYTDEESNWHMLTGYYQNEIEAFARDKFKTIIIKPKTSHQVLHGTSFYLVNQQGIVVKEYNYANSSYAEELMKDIKKMQKK